ncbi:hypothetical protein D3C75_779960 [compost metagenome]
MKLPVRGDNRAGNIAEPFFISSFADVAGFQIGVAGLHIIQHPDLLVSNLHVILVIVGGDEFRVNITGFVPFGQQLQGSAGTFGHASILRLAVGAQPELVRSHIMRRKNTGEQLIGQLASAAQSIRVLLAVAIGVIVDELVQHILHLSQGLRR